MGQGDVMRRGELKELARKAEGMRKGELIDLLDDLEILRGVVEELLEERGE